MTLRKFKIGETVELTERGRETFLSLNGRSAEVIGLHPTMPLTFVRVRFAGQERVETWATAWLRRVDVAAGVEAGQ